MALWREAFWWCWSVLSFLCSYRAGEVLLLGAEAGALQKTGGAVRVEEAGKETNYDFYSYSGFGKV